MNRDKLLFCWEASPILVLAAFTSIGMVLSLINQLFLIVFLFLGIVGGMLCMMYFEHELDRTKKVEKQAINEIEHLLRAKMEIEEAIEEARMLDRVKTNEENRKL